MLRPHDDTLGLCNHLAGNMEYQLFIYIDKYHLLVFNLGWVKMGDYGLNHFL